VNDSGPDRRRGAEVLGDLPVSLWGPLLRAVRRAAGGLDRAELPPALRPFASWKPEKLAADRPRRAVAEALAGDPRLRELVGEALEDRDAFAAAESTDVARLRAAHGTETAAAALAARGRWDDLAVLAAEAGARIAARERVTAEGALQREVEQSEATRRRLAEELGAVRAERDAQRRRADEAEGRLRAGDGEQRKLLLERAAMRARVAELGETLDRERRRSDDRAARLRRRLAEAEERARVDDVRAARAVDQLERLAAELRGALTPEGAAPGSGAPGSGARGSGGPGSGGPGSGAPGSEPSAAPAPRPVRPTDQPAHASTVPRGVAAAEAGRPCRLPPGLGPSDPLAVASLLQVPGLEVVVDGYNVTRDDCGLAHGTLMEQRLWLVRLAGAVAARHRRRMTVVFDGTDLVPGAMPSTRGVLVAFSSGDETADDRIVALVDDLADDVPVLVVSSDRAVQRDCEARGANVAPSRSFLAAAGG